MILGEREENRGKLKSGRNKKDLEEERIKKGDIENKKVDGKRKAKKNHNYIEIGGERLQNHPSQI